MAALDPTSKTIASYPRNDEMPEFVFMKEGTGARATIVAQRIIGTDSVVESYALDDSYKRIDAIPVDRRSSSEQMVMWLLAHQYIPVIRNDKVFFEPMQEISHAALSHQNQTANNPSIELSLTFPTFFGTDVPATEFQRAFIAEQEAALQPGGDQIKLEAIRRCFEGYLGRIAGETQGDEQLRDRSCFICFNFSEEDVRSCVGKFLMGDLEKVGLKVYCSRKDLGPGKSISNFQANISRATVVLLVCTPEGKIKVDERDARGTREGIADEIKLLRTSFQAGRQEGTVFLTFVKGGRNNACLYDQFLDAMDRKMHHAAEYYESAIELYGVMRGLKLEDSSGLQGRFITDALSILSGTTLPSREEINLWKRSIEPKWLERERRVRELMDYPLATLQAHLKKFYSDQQKARGQTQGILKIPSSIQGVDTQLRMRNEFDRMGNIRLQDTSLSKDFIPPEKLFQEEKLIGAPNKRTVIFGDPGVGKTTFARMVAKRGAEFWPEFPVILLIHLGNLSEGRYLDKLGGYSVYDILAKECGFEQDLYYYQDMLEDPNFRNKILLVLDGYDELHPRIHGEGSTLYNAFVSLLNDFPHFLITSRLTTIEAIYACQFEMTGFNVDSVRAYVGEFFQGFIHSEANFTPAMATEKQMNLLSILKRPSPLNNLIEIPMNLALVCSLFKEDESMFGSDHDFTVTRFYIEVVDLMIKRYLIRLHERGILSESLPSIRNRVNLIGHPRVKLMIKALALIAWNAVAMKTFCLNRADIEIILDQNDLNCEMLVDLGFISIENGIGQFIHSTFQEFFAALHLANVFLDGNCEEGKKHISKNKFNPRYRNTLTMAVGYLSHRGNHEVEQSFFNHLFDAPRDRAGNGERALFGQCFGQCKNPAAIRQYSAFLYHCLKYIHHTNFPLSIIGFLGCNNQLFHDHRIVSMIFSEMARNRKRRYDFMFVLNTFASNKHQLPPPLLKVTITHDEKKIDSLIRSLRDFSSHQASSELEELTKKGEPILGKIIDGLIQELIITKKLKLAPEDVAGDILQRIARQGAGVCHNILERFEHMVKSPLDEDVRGVVVLTVARIVKQGGVSPVPDWVEEFLCGMLRDQVLGLIPKLNAALASVEMIKQGEPLQKLGWEYLVEMVADSRLETDLRIKIVFVLAKNLPQGQALPEGISGFFDEILRGGDKLYLSVWNHSILVEAAKQGEEILEKVVHFLIEMIKFNSVSLYDTTSALIEVSQQGADIADRIFDKLAHTVQTHPRMRIAKALAGIVVKGQLDDLPGLEEAFEMLVKDKETRRKGAECLRTIKTKIQDLLSGCHDREGPLSSSSLTPIITETSDVEVEAIKKIVDAVNLRRSVRNQIAQALSEGVKHGQTISRDALNKLNDIIKDTTLSRSLRDEALQAIKEVVQRGGIIPQEVVSFLLKMVLKGQNCGMNQALLAYETVIEIVKRKDLVSVELLQTIVDSISSPEKKDLWEEFFLFGIMSNIHTEALAEAVTDHPSYELIQFICCLTFRSFVIDDGKIYINDQDQQISRPCPPTFDIHMLEMDQIYRPLPTHVFGADQLCSFNFDFNDDY